MGFATEDGNDLGETVGPLPPLGGLDTAEGKKIATSIHFIWYFSYFEVFALLQLVAGRAAS